MAILENTLRFVRKIFSGDQLERELKTGAKKSEKLHQHKEFLKSLYDDERARLDNLENKTSQLISQTSLIIALASIFLPLMIDRSHELNLCLKIILLVLLISIYLLYVLTIIYALKNYHLSKFKYSSPAGDSVITFKDRPIDDFNEELIQDYLYSISTNQEINNRKATNIIKSYRVFKYANILLCVLIILICILSIFRTGDSEKIQIINPVAVELITPIQSAYCMIPLPKPIIIIKT